MRGILLEAPVDDWTGLLQTLCSFGGTAQQSSGGGWVPMGGCGGDIWSSFPAPFELPRRSGAKTGCPHAQSETTPLLPLSTEAARLQGGRSVSNYAQDILLFL